MKLELDLEEKDPLLLILATEASTARTYKTIGPYGKIREIEEEHNRTNVWLKLQKHT